MLPGLERARLAVESALVSSTKGEESKLFSFPDTLMRYLTAATLTTNATLDGSPDSQDLDSEESIPDFSRRSSASTASSTCSEGPSTPSHSVSPARRLEKMPEGDRESTSYQARISTKAVPVHPSLSDRPSTPSVLPFAPFASSSARPRRNSNSTLVMAPVPAPTTTKLRHRSRRPSREEEESSRSRSRFPHLLWNSTIDPPSLAVLENYWERTQGQGSKLPQLDRSSKNGIAEFSRALEAAGL